MQVQFYLCKTFRRICISAGFNKFATVATLQTYSLTVKLAHLWLNAASRLSSVLLLLLLLSSLSCCSGVNRLRWRSPWRSFASDVPHCRCRRFISVSCRLSVWYLALGSWGLQKTGPRCHGYLVTPSFADRSFHFQRGSVGSERAVKDGGQGRRLLRVGYHLLRKYNK